MNSQILSINNAVPQFEYFRFRKPINWLINEGEHWTIIGANGAGKTQLINILLGKIALSQGRIECVNNQSIMSVVKYVAFTNIYSYIDVSHSYYQQRWNVGDVQNTPTVKDLFKDKDTTKIKYLLQLFNIRVLMEKNLNMLSSGELRKILIVISLLSAPRILILDNPYIGLDTNSRTILNHIFKLLANLNKIQIVTIVSDPTDIPSITTNILPIKDKDLLSVCTRKSFFEDTDIQKKVFDRKYPFVILPESKKIISNYNNVLIFKNVLVKYGDRIILDKINWQVRRGEKWLLIGKNGSGKSTLLGLIFCDNPQSYANDILLFDKKRGSGESIWDIKKRIGFVSPELAIYYRKNINCINIVASGLFDTMGLRENYNDLQKANARKWMSIFGIKHLEHIPFLSISTGEQQLTLLARAFVKEPELLILDEPLHGLDFQNKLYVNQIIEKYCDSEKSLIYVTHYPDEIPSFITDQLTLNTDPT